MQQKCVRSFSSGFFPGTTRFQALALGVVATIPVGSFPAEVAVTPDGTFAYVGHTSGSPVSVIATATNTVTTTIPIPSVPDVKITPNGAFAYAASFSGVSVFSTASNTVVATVPTSGRYLAITPNGAYAYVVTTFGGIAVIDTATNTVSTTIPTAGGAVRISITPDGAFAWVSNTFGGSIDIFATATNTLASTIVAGFPTGIVFVTPLPPGPTTKAQCKNGGWQTFTNPKFKNQGDCISYVNHLP